MLSPAQVPCLPVVPESESGFFRRPLPGVLRKNLLLPGKRGRAGKRIFFILFFHNRGQVKNNNKLAFQTFSGTLPAMSRTLRIEYPGAVYHVQSEGNRGDAIYLDDEDREIFLRTFQEAARRSGWTVYAYALMANHYHILFQTVRANLVDGMKWLQTAYTQRFNARHRMRGHLFAGRYHAMVVEADNAHYFSTIIDYIHLNPARSGLARHHTFLSGCKWTSLPAWLDSPAKRPKWIHPERGLVCFGCDDTEDGRQKYLNHLMGRFEAERMDERSLLPAGHVGPGTVQRGWCYGSSAFRARLVGELPRLARRKPVTTGMRASEIGEYQAEIIVKNGLKAFGLSEEELLVTPYSHPSKLIIALAVRQSTLVPYAWISNRLHMGIPKSMGTLLHRAKKMAETDLKTRAWIERLSA